MNTASFVVNDLYDVNRAVAPTALYSAGAEC